METSGQIALVLDYAEPTPRLWFRQALLVAGRFAFILLAAALGAAIGNVLSPKHWRAHVLLKITDGNVVSRVETTAQIAQRTAGVAATLQSPQATRAVLQDLSARGYSQASEQH